MKKGRGRLGVVSIALVTVLVAALLEATYVSSRLFQRPRRWATSAGRSAAPDLGAEGGSFAVIAADGEVRAFRAGKWIPVKQGDHLTRDDYLRTSAGGHAVLRFSAGSEVELREKVEIRLDRLTAAGATVDLRRGKVVARVTAAGDALAITARDTRTSTEGPAHFVVMTNEQGQVSVAALKGSARFAAAGKTVTVPEGSETRSKPGQPPEDPERIPEEVLLQVVWPAGERQRAETTSVQGRVGLDAMVTVNGARTPVGPDGRFTAEVPLRDGPNLLEVETEDMTGRTRKESTTLVRRPARPPKLTPEPAELWKKE
jgi:hypothetical protein